MRGAILRAGPPIPRRKWPKPLVLPGKRSNSPATIHPCSGWQALPGGSFASISTAPSNSATAGHPDEALEQLRLAFRLSPFDPEGFFTMSAMGCAYMMAGRFDEALDWT